MWPNTLSTTASIIKHKPSTFPPSINIRISLKIKAIHPFYRKVRPLECNLDFTSQHILYPITHLWEQSKREDRHMTSLISSVFLMSGGLFNWGLWISHCLYQKGSLFIIQRPPTVWGLREDALHLISNKSLFTATRWNPVSAFYRIQCTSV